MMLPINLDNSIKHSHLRGDFDIEILHPGLALG